MRSKNVYTNLIKDENSFTEAFINILSENTVLNIFIDYISKYIKFDTSVITHADFSTQTSYKYNSRPDITIKYNDVIIFIENKISIYTELTDKQPSIYLKSLKSIMIKNKQLLFIIPKNYVHEDTIRKRYEEWKISNTICNIGFAILYWEDIMEKIKRCINESWFTDFEDIADSYFT